MKKSLQRWRGKMRNKRQIHLSCTRLQLAGLERRVPGLHRIGEAITSNLTSVVKSMGCGLVVGAFGRLGNQREETRKQRVVYVLKTIPRLLIVRQPLVDWSNKSRADSWLTREHSYATKSVIRYKHRYENISIHVRWYIYIYICIYISIYIYVYI